MSKAAKTDHPVHDLVARRFSPYVWADRDVSDGDLRSIFEAARWAASSYNEQPWSYIVATRSQPDAHAKLLACLVPPNQAWASAAPVLALGVARLRFERNDKPNKAALHDLGLASATLTFEANARGLHVHQMIGILPDEARARYAIPEGCEAVTGIAIGYAGDPDSAAEPLAGRDRAPRERKALREFVFGSAYGSPFEPIA